MSLFILVLTLVSAVTSLRHDPESILFRGDLSAIVGGREAAAPPEDDPVAFVAKENQWARVVGRRHGQYPNSYYRFLGLRYAEPPVGPLRFQRPRKMALSGDVGAFKFGAPCPQPDPDKAGSVLGSEDCLFLNIFTPRLPESDDLLPVIFWIHGGDYRRGSASQYGGGFLARRDLVVVTVQYRLGSLGFLSTGQEELPGNVAMFDLAAALGWVREYIAFFGGDPRRIIPAGQGTGGSSATMMAFSNVTQGRMGGVIAMSGSATSPFAVDPEPEDAAIKLAKENGCPLSPTIKMVKCLQQLPLEKLITADSSLQDLRKKAKGLLGVKGILTPAPVVEHAEDRRTLPPYLAEAPAQSLELGHFPDIPLLSGVTKHETAGAITGGLRNQVIDSLKNIPQFLDQVLLKGLVQDGVNKFQSIATATGQNALKFLSSNYKNVKPPSITDSLNQVIETTSDALFNFPAFVQSQAWVKRKLPAYFYSFEHNGRLKGFVKVLKGSLLVSDEQLVEEEDNKASSHGSDLPYLFDLRNLDGSEDAEFNESTPLHPDDQAVRDNFLSIIERFAKKGKVEVGGKTPAFPGYITIGAVTQLGTSFRECQMALWSGQQTGSKCPSLDLVTSKLTQGIGGIYTGAENVVNKLPGLGSLNPSGKPPPKFNLGVG